MQNDYYDIFPRSDDMNDSELTFYIYIRYRASKIVGNIIMVKEDR